MNEFILFRALFFMAMILLAAVIIAVIALLSSLASRSQLKNERKTKARAARKLHPVVFSGRVRQNPLPASTSLTIERSWLDKVYI